MEETLNFDYYNLGGQFGPSNLDISQQSVFVKLKEFTFLGKGNYIYKVPGQNFKESESCLYIHN